MAADPHWIDATWRAALDHHAAGRIREAAVLYKQIVTADPTHAEALHHLGCFAHAAGRPTDAARILGVVCQLRPGWPDPLVNLGLVLHATARHGAAIDCYQRAIALAPDLAIAHNNLGSAYQATGQLDLAIASYRRATEIDPAYAGAHGNLGNVLREAGRASEAVVAHRRAAGLQPADARAQLNLSLSLFDAGQFTEAAEARQAAARLDPSLVDAGGPFNNAVIAAQQAASAGRPADAAAAYRRAAELRPERADVWHNLSVVLVEAGDPDAALAAVDRALALQPDDPVTLNNRAGALKSVGRITEAVASCRRAIALGGPTARPIQGNLAYIATFDPAASAADLRDAAQRYDVRRPGAPGFAPRPAGRVIRVGYVSPDFRDHVVGRNLLPVLREHDRSAFEVYCYANVTRPDPFTDRCRSTADHWRDIATLTDDAAADLVRADGIDVLVDLTLHLAGSRLGLFDRCPAPAQATFGGYPGTTGLSSVGYRLTDPYLDPPGTDADYAERSIRLPHSFWCYDADAMDLAHTPDPGPPPALANGHVTFGCLNNFSKVNDDVLSAWRRVLDGVPGARLTLFAPAGQARDRVRAALGANRVTFVPFMSRGDYHAAYQAIDLCLDTFPYNGHTTSLDGLWMGVPTVTFVGRTVVGRAGSSQLSNLGLTELAAADVDGFVATAIRLAGDLPRLAQLRRELRGRMRRSPLMDAVGFTRGVESALQGMLADAFATPAAPV